MNYTITKLWNNKTIESNDKIDLSFHYVKNNKTSVNDLSIKVLAPYYNDPKIPENTSVGSMDKLWEYEVVEVFLLGSDDHYLEIELGPKGQYLLLQLHGYRNVTKYPLFLDEYSARIDGNKWCGKAIIPNNYLPTDLSKFNAYAIHGSDTRRQYLALFPTPNGKYSEPDFHRLNYFSKFDLK